MTDRSTEFATLVTPERLAYLCEVARSARSHREDAENDREVLGWLTNIAEARGGQYLSRCSTLVNPLTGRILWQELHEDGERRWGFGNGWKRYAN